MQEERKLVTLKRIDSITPIPDADRIVVAHIGGWTAVVGKDEFFEGQEVFYFETDSMLPLDKKPFEFLRSRGVKEKDGKEYHRLKAMKLRGVVSDGLILPYSVAKEFVSDPNNVEDEVAKIIESGGNFTEFFGVVKYEDPILAKLGGKMTHFPDWIQKTDEERIQNLANLLGYINQTNSFKDWYATEKIDGTSCTIWCEITEDGFYNFGVCSRNYGLVEEDDNTYWQIARTPLINYNDELLSPIDYLKEKCLESARACTWGTNTPRYVLQGEIFGEGIQNNPLDVKGQHILFYNFIEDGNLVLRRTLEDRFPELMSNWVPIHNISLQNDLEAIIKQPDGVTTRVPGANPNAQIEGFVWRSSRDTELLVPKRKSEEDIDWSKIPEEKWDLVKKSLNEKTRASFKAISDKYRLKHQG